MFYLDKTRFLKELRQIDDSELLKSLGENGIAIVMPEEERAGLKRFMRVLGAEDSAEIEDVSEEDIVEMMVSMNSYLRYLEDGGGLKHCNRERLQERKSAVRRIL